MTQSEMDTGMARVREAMDELPQAETVNVDAAWTPVRIWSLAAGAAVAVTALLVITVAPIRAWAENLLSVFRVEHVAVLDITSGSLKALENDPAFNQSMT